MEMDFEINSEAIKKIAEAGFDPAFGARPLKRAIQSEIENPLAKKILAGDFHRQRQSGGRIFKRKIYLH